MVGVGEEAGVWVAQEDLDLVAVAAAAEQKTAVGRDVELAGMGGCGLVADAREEPCLGVHCKDGDALVFQTIA